MRRYEAIFNQTYQFTGLMEPDGTLIEANDTALKFGGISREDVIGKKVWNVHWFEISEETRKQTKEDVQRAADGEFVRRELEVQGADDTAIIDFSIRPITDDTGNVALLVPEGRNITDLKEREAQLERTHGLREHTERIADVGSWEVNADTRNVFWSENLFDILDVDGDEEPPLDEALDVYYEDDRSIVETAVEDALETGESFDVEARFQRSDDEIRWLRVQGTPTVEDGEVVTLRGAVQDITGYKRIEAELRNQRDLVEGIIETSPIGITVVDADGTISFVNERAKEINGWSSKEFGGFTHDDPRWDLVDEIGNPLETEDTPFERVLSQEESIFDQRSSR